MWLIVKSTPHLKAKENDASYSGVELSLCKVPGGLGAANSSEWAHGRPENEVNMRKEMACSGAVNSYDGGVGLGKGGVVEKTQGRSEAKQYRRDALHLDAHRRSEEKKKTHAGGAIVGEEKNGKSTAGRFQIEGYGNPKQLQSAERGPSYDFEAETCSTMDGSKSRKVDWGMFAGGKSDGRCAREGG